MEELRERMLVLEEEASEEHKLELMLEEILYKIKYLMISTRYVRNPGKKEKYSMEVVRTHVERKKKIIENTLQELMNEKLYDKN